MQGGAGRCRGGAGRCREVQGWLHHLHLGKHNIRCREVQAVQAHLRFMWIIRPGLDSREREKSPIQCQLHAQAN